MTKSRMELCFEINRLARENKIGDFFFATKGCSIWNVNSNDHIREIVELQKKLEKEVR